MTTFLGKYWLIRSLLWLMAGGLCFVVWPKLALWPKKSLLYHASLEPIVFYYDQHRNLMAWNYMSDRHWSVAGLNARPRLRFCGAGDKSIAMLDGANRVRVVEITFPNEERIYSLPDLGTPAREFDSTDLLLVTNDERFAVIRQVGTRSISLCFAIDLVNAQVIDQMKLEGTTVGARGPNEIEQYVEDFSSSPTKRFWKRWQLDEQGRFIELPPPKLRGLPDEIPNYQRRIGFTQALSLNDQLIVRSKDGQLDVFNPQEDTIVSTLRPIINHLRFCFFTSDDTRVATETATHDIEVWDVQTGKRVAAKERWPQIVRILWIIGICGMAGFAVACILACTADSPRICLYDFALAITFWLIFRSVSGFRPIEQIDEATVTVNLLATVVGVYWGVGPGRLWSRLWHSVLVMFPITLGLTARLASETAYDRALLDKVYFHPIEIARECSIPVISAIASCLATAPLTWFGYRVANETDAARPTGWNVRFYNFLALIAGIAFCFVFFQLYLTAREWRAQDTTLYNLEPVGGKLEFAFEILYMTALGAAPIAVLLAWLGLWQWTRWRTVVFSIIGAFIGIASVLLFGQHLYWLAPKTFGYWGAMADVAATFLLPVTTLAVPFVIGRRAGYRWVGQTPIPVAAIPPQAGG